MFETIVENGKARIGLLHVKNGEIETPTFFPVHDLRPDSSYNTPRYWEIFKEINNGMFNASLIQLFSKEKLNKLFDIGLRKYLNFNGNIFMDSGGYIYKKYGLSVKQEKLLETQEKLDADIASTLDYPDLTNKKFTTNNILMSVENAKKCLMNKKDEGMLLYASIHGYDPFIIRNVIRHLRNYGEFDGYALGSLMKIYSDYSFLTDMILTIKREIKDKPLHVYGLGGIVIIPLLIYLGVDSMDSSSFVIAASNKSYFMPNFNRISIHNIKEDLSTICNCKICEKYSKNEIVNSRELLSYHNIWVLWKEIEKTKKGITEGIFEKYLKNRFCNNAWARLAFKYARRKLRLGLKGDS